LAYAAAVAGRTLGEMPDRVVVGVSGSIIKNLKSVIVPNTGHLKGINAAVTAGIVAGKPEKELEVIGEVTQEQIIQMKEFMEETEVRIEHIKSGFTFDIIATLHKDSSYSKVRIANYHINIVLIEKDGNILKQREASMEEQPLTDRGLLNMEDIWDFINAADISDIKEILDRQIQYTGPLPKKGLGVVMGSISVPGMMLLRRQRLWRRLVRMPA